MLTSEYRKFTKNDALIDTIEIKAGTEIMRLCNISNGDFTFGGQLYYGRPFTITIANRQAVLPINARISIAGVHEEFYNTFSNMAGSLTTTTVTYRQFLRVAETQVGYDLITILVNVVISNGLITLVATREIDSERLVPLYQVDFSTLPFSRSLLTPNNKLATSRSG